MESSRMYDSVSTQRIYIYNAEFTAAVILVHETVEIEGNEFICLLNWDLHTKTAAV